MMKRIIFFFLLLFSAEAMGQTDSTVYRIKMPDSTYSAKLVGVAGTRTEGEEIVGTYSSTYRMHEFYVKKTGPYQLYGDPAGGTNYVLISSWGKASGKVVPGRDLGDFFEYFDFRNQKIIMNGLCILSDTLATDSTLSKGWYFHKDTLKGFARAKLLLSGVNLVLPHTTTPTISNTGELWLKTSVNGNEPLLYYFGDQEMLVVAIPEAQYSTSDTFSVVYDPDNNRFGLKPYGSGSGGGGTVSRWDEIQDPAVDDTIRFGALSIVILADSFKIGDSAKNGFFWFDSLAQLRLEGLARIVLPNASDILITGNKDDGPWLGNSGDVGTGDYDFHTTTQFRIPVGTGRTLSLAGDLYFDTNGVDTTVTNGVLKIYSGSEEIKFFGVSTTPDIDKSVMLYSSDLNQVTWSPVSMGFLGDVDTTGKADGKILKWSAANNEWKVANDSVGSGGSGDSSWVSASADTFTVADSMNVDGIFIYSPTHQSIGVAGSPPTLGAKMDVNGTLICNNLMVGNYTFPSVDGTSGQLLKTNGAGTLYWADDSVGSGSATLKFSKELLPKDANVMGRFIIDNGAIISLAEKLIFDDGDTRSEAYWSFFIENYQGDSIYVDIYYTMATSNTDNVEWEAKFMTWGAGDNPTTSSFGTIKTKMKEVPGTVGNCDVARIVFSASEADGFVSGKNCIFHLTTDADDSTNDTAAGDRYVWKVYIHEK